MAHTTSPIPLVPWLFCFPIFLIVGAATDSTTAAIGAAVTVHLYLRHWVQWAESKGAFKS
jgi:hypothetical protein